jgi:hypothetical protein
LDIYRREPPSPHPAPHDVPTGNERPPRPLPLPSCPSDVTSDGRPPPPHLTQSYVASTTVTTASCLLHLSLTSFSSPYILLIVRSICQLSLSLLWHFFSRAERGRWWSNDASQMATTGVTPSPWRCAAGTWYRGCCIPMGVHCGSPCVPRLQCAAGGGAMGARPSAAREAGMGRRTRRMVRSHPLRCTTAFHHVRVTIMWTVEQRRENREEEEISEKLVAPQETKSSFHKYLTVGRCNPIECQISNQSCYQC